MEAAEGSRQAGASEPGIPKGNLGSPRGGARMRPPLPEGGRLIVYLAVLTASYGWLLVELGRHALAHELHSHILLVPVISGWLLWTNRHQSPAASSPRRSGAIFFALAGVAALAFFLARRHDGILLSANDALAVGTASYVCFVAAGGFALMGRKWMRAMAFPFCFLAFMIPMPDAMAAAVEKALIMASGEVVPVLFEWAGISFFREGLVFEVPGITLEIATECSGIRSTWVLLIIGTLASHLFLASRWRKALLLLIVVPLSIIRNAVRILVIALLCVHHGPHMINSFIHREGGPLFFAAAAGILAMVALFLRQSEIRASRNNPQKNEQ